jgi:plastocyanin
MLAYFQEVPLMRHRIARAAVWLVVVSPASVAAAQAMNPNKLDGVQQIEVVAKDYAFTPLPTHVRAGPTIFSFSNQGTVQHEASLARLKEAATIDDVLKLIKEGGRPRDVVERSIGILIARPGQSPDGKLWVELLPGRSYMLICTLKDKPDSPAHAMLGMYTAFKAQ